MGKVITAIDLGEKYIKIAQGEKIDRNKINILGVSLVETSNIKKHVVIDLEGLTYELEEGIRNLEQLSGFDVESVYISISGEGTEIVNAEGYTVIKDPENGISQIDIDSIESQLENINTNSINKEKLDTIIVEYIIDDTKKNIKNPINMPGMKLEAKAIIMRSDKNLIKNYRKIFEDILGIKINKFILASRAAEEAVLTPEDRELGVMLLDIGYAYSNIYIIKENKPITYGYLPLGSWLFVNDIKKVLDISISEANKILKKYNNIDSPESLETIQYTKKSGEVSEIEYKMIRDIIYSRLKYNFDYIKKEFFNKNTLQKLSISDLDSGIVLVGGGSKLKFIDNLLSSITKTNVRIGEVEGLKGYEEFLKDPQFANVFGVLKLASKNDSFKIEKKKSDDVKIDMRLKSILDWINKYFREIF